MTDPDLSPETRSLIDRGRHGHALPDGRRRGLKRAVLAHVAAGTVMATTTTAAAWTTSALNAASVGVLVLFVGGGIHAALTRNEPAPAPQMNVIAKAAGAAGATRAARPTRASEVPAPEAAAGASPAALPVPIPDTDPPMTAPPVVVPPAQPLPTPHVATARAVASPRANDPATIAASPSTAASLEVPAAVASAPVTPVAPSSLEAEAQLLREADRALKGGDPAGCLTLLEEHATRFPAGVLEPERAAERVLALCAAGRTADAESAARTFLAGHAAGPLASRVRASCAAPGL